jgi:glycosyltransferase involved in cell wall biosynthesis
VVSRSGGERCVLLIPAYKPSPDLPELLGRIRRADAGKSIGAALIVDDGSGPEFAAIFDALRALPGVTVIDHAINLGKGAALKTGFNHALLAWPDAAGVVTADADGQHAPEDIVRVAAALLESPPSLILGVRQFHDIPMRSLVGNRISRLVFRIFAGFPLSDTQTGLRGWPRASCIEALKIQLNGYDFELESLMKKDPGLRLREVPIKTIYIDGNKSSHFNPLRDSMRISFVFLRYCGSSALGASVDYLIFMLALHWGATIGWSQFSARVAAVAVAFVLARNLVFRSGVSWVGSLLKYLLLVATMGVVSYSMIRFLVERFGMGIIVAKALSEGALFLSNFAIQRQFIFSRR